MTIKANINVPVEATLLVSVNGETRPATDEDLAAFGYVKEGQVPSEEKAQNTRKTSEEKLREDPFSVFEELFASRGRKSPFDGLGQPFFTTVFSTDNTADTEAAKKEADEIAKKVNETIQQGAEKASQFFKDISKNLNDGK